MEVKVTSKECGDERVQVECKERVEGRGVVNVVIEINELPSLWSSTDINDEERGVGGKVFTGGDPKFIASKWMVTVMNSGIDHDFRTLFVSEERIVKVPFGMRGATQDVATVDGRVTASHAHRVKPWFLNKQDVISIIRGQKSVHCSVPAPHVD